MTQLQIEDHWSFIRVAYIHNASYLGGVIGRPEPQNRMHQVR